MVKYLVEIGLQEVCRNHLVTSQQILKKKNLANFFGCTLTSRFYFLPPKKSYGNSVIEFDNLVF